MPYAVSPTGLVHTTRCRHAPAGPTHPDRRKALAVGRRLARCCLDGLVAGAAGGLSRDGAALPRARVLPVLAPPKRAPAHGVA